MPAKFHAPNDPLLCAVSDLRDGDVAVIAEGPYMGRVVQMIHDCTSHPLRSIADKSGISWAKAATFKVRKLQPGELIEITE